MSTFAVDKDGFFSKRKKYVMKHTVQKATFCIRRRDDCWTKETYKFQSGPSSKGIPSLEPN